jgi:MFS transporter, CP family, cyanate transporter
MTVATLSRGSAIKRPVRITSVVAMMNAVAGGLGWSVIPPFLPEISEELGLSHTMAGFVWGSVPLGVALASPIGGLLVDRTGSPLVAGLAMIAAGAAVAARALVHEAWTMALVMLVFGLATGIIIPALPKTLAEHVAVPRLARANGVMMLSYTFTTALTMLLARTHLAPAFGGFRGTMVFTGALMTATAFIWMAVVPRAPVVPQGAHGFGFDLMANAEFRKVVLIFGLWNGSYLALFGLLPRALLSRGLDDGGVRVAITSWLLVAGIANFLGPVLSDRFAQRRTFFVLGALVAGGALVVLAVNSALSTSMTMGLLTIAALGVGGFAPVLLTMPVELDEIGVERAGAAAGLVVLAGQIGGFLLPVIAGAAADKHVSSALFLLALAHLVMVLPAGKMQVAKA